MKVHAAEFLLELDYPAGVEDAFLKELETFGQEPEYRIGIWRVLARASYNPNEKRSWVSRIRDVFLNPEAPDRLHASETLAKLGYKIPEGPEAQAEREAFEHAAAGEDGMAVFARWILVANDPRAQRGTASGIAGIWRCPHPWACRLLHFATCRRSRQPRCKALIHPAEQSRRIRLGACTSCAPQPYIARPKTAANGMSELLRYTSASETSERYQACQTLAQLATGDDLPLLTERMNDGEADVRSAAAYALLRLGRRATHSMSYFDWAVIGLYAVGMLAVGWYYSRRTATTDDYLLGGRNMNPLNVGLSLFATLLSTISYLAYPGEMIRYGPMILAMVVAYPFVALVVGWLMIPFFMRLQVTSAYQILEMRLGSVFACWDRPSFFPCACCGWPSSSMPRPTRCSCRC